MALFSMALPAVVSAQGLSGMTISPLMFRNQVGAGQKATLQLQVQNLQQDSLNIRLSVQPVEFDDWTYNPKFGGTPAHDCSNWFTSPELNQIVLPNNQGLLNLPMKVPHIRPGVYWCEVRVSPHFQNDPSTINPEYQIPVILFVGSQPRPSLKLGTPKLVLDNKVEQIEVPFENPSEGFTVIGATVELRQAATGRVIGTYYDLDRNLYPGTKRNLVFSVGELGEGQYLITSKPQAGTRSFSPMAARFNVTKTGISEASANETYELSPITFDPASILVQMPAGGERSAVLHVINNSSKPTAVKIEVRALSQGMDGAFDVGTTPPIGPLVVTADPETVQLDPGRTASVRIAISTSKDATGDLWFGVSAGSQDSHEISEQIYGNIRLPGGIPKLDLKQTEIKKIGQYPYFIGFEIANSGNMSLKPIPFAQVLEQGLTPVANLQVPVIGGGGILPGSVLRNSILLPPNLKPGVYSVSIKYQYGQDLFATLNVPITIPAGGKPKPKAGKAK
ncbi:MAG TPA: hypothetical protein VGL56_06980 [Fimbriimonadaceae bacterium]